MIYVVASHQGFVGWMMDNRGKDAIHVATIDRAQGLQLTEKDEIHLGHGGDPKVYDELVLRRGRA